MSERGCVILFMILMLLRTSTSRVSRLWIFELPNSCSAGADIVALGTLWGIAACGGPPIPCRGRRTALGPGPLEVPEPSQDFATYTEKFRLQGFSPTEMIALVLDEDEPFSFPTSPLLCLGFTHPRPRPHCALFAFFLHFILSLASLIIRWSCFLCSFVPFFF